jgi:hypothetical protein
MKNRTLLCHELCCTKTIPIIFWNWQFTSNTDHKGDLNNAQGWGFQHSETGHRHSASGSWHFKASRRAPSSSVSNHLHLNMRVPRSFQTTRTTHKTTKSQKVLIFSKTAVRTSNLTISEQYYCYVLTAKQQFTSITFKQCAGETENLCFYSRHLTFLLSVTCANPQKSLTQAHQPSQMSWLTTHNGRGTNQIVIMKFVTNNWVVTTTVIAT